MVTIAGRDAAAQAPGHPDHARVLPRSKPRPAPEASVEWPGHSGPVVGAGLLFGNIVGVDAFLGWAGRWVAPAVWARAAFDPDLNIHTVLGVAVRSWGTAMPRRLYVEGRIGYDEMWIAEYEEPEVGPSRPSRRGVMLGVAAGFEALSVPVLALDLRAGVDFAAVEDYPRPFAWLGLAMTFY